MLPLPLLVVSSLQALQKVHETFQSDIEAEKNRIGQLEALAQELNDYRYSQADAINARMQVCRRGHGRWVGWCGGVETTNSCG